MSSHMVQGDHLSSPIEHYLTKGMKYSDKFTFVAKIYTGGGDSTFTQHSVPYLTVRKYGEYASEDLIYLVTFLVVTECLCLYHGC